MQVLNRALKVSQSPDAKTPAGDSQTVDLRGYAG